MTCSLSLGKRSSSISPNPCFFCPRWFPPTGLAHRMEAHARLSFHIGIHRDLLPNRPTIHHRHRNCAPASPASRPPLPREEHERLEHDEDGHRNAESVCPYRNRVGELQSVVNKQRGQQSVLIAPGIIGL